MRTKTTTYNGNNRVPCPRLRGHVFPHASSPTNPDRKGAGYLTSKNHAFTLIELMIVVVILGILATTIMPKIMNRPEQARRTKAKVEIQQIETALASFKLDTGRYPTTSEGLAALVNDPGIENYNPGGYLDKLPNDPWSSPYKYLQPSANNRDYDLESYGKDGENGGNDENADIENWNLN